MGGEDGALSEPTLVSGLSNAVAVAAGSDHSLALEADGTVWAWGNNFDGQLGDGTTTDRASPVPVKGLSGVTSIAAAGNGYSLALKADGTVWAWGNNFYGQLGDGTTSNRLLPVAVSNLSNVSAISAGSSSVALRMDGSVWEWGLGKRLPVMNSGISNVTAIAAGGGFTLAVKADGTVWAWGRNHAGQLGDGTRTDRAVPGPVTGLSGVVAIAAGSSTTRSPSRTTGARGLGDTTSTANSAMVRPATRP